MNKPSKDTARLNAAIESAESAFWADIVTNYPEAEHGDFSPEATIALDNALRTAVTLWLEWNADPQDNEPKVTEVLLHRIEYTYDYEELEVSHADAEYIANKITQGFSEGELCTFAPVSPDSEQEVRGYWKINNNPDA